MHKLQLAVSQRWLAAGAKLGWHRPVKEEISEGNVLLNGARQIALATPRKKRHFPKCVAATLALEKDAGNKNT